MGKRKTGRGYKRYAEEFRREAVKLCRKSDQSIAAVAQMLGVSSRQLGRWKRQADIDDGRGPVGALTTEQLHELRKLRRENAELKMALDITKKAQALSAARKRLELSKRRGSDTE